MIERPQWNQFRTGVLVAGQQAEFEIQLEMDAPFVARGLGIASTDGTTTGLLALRYTRPDGAWAQRLLATEFFNNQGGLLDGIDTPEWMPLQPNMPYLPGGVIRVQVQNLDVGSIGPLLICFVGTRAYCDGQVWSPDRPKQYRAIPFAYNLPITASTTVAQTLRDVPFHVQADADFLWCLGAFSDNLFNVNGSGSAALGLALKFRDYSGKYYMNDFISARQVFTGSGPQEQSRAELFPGIYIPRENNLYFDIQTGLAGGGAASFTITFSLIGFKVYPK